MAKQFLVNINMGGNQIINPIIAQGTLGNGSTSDSAGLAKVQNLSSLSTTNATAGMIAYDTTSGQLKVYVAGSTNAWTAVGSGVTSVNSLTGGLTIAGTSNQIAVNSASTTITLSLPTNVTLPGKTTLTASTTSAAALNIPSGVAPTTPSSGDFWNSSGLLYLYNGTATKTVAFTDSNITGSAGSLTNALTIGTGLSGTSYNGSSAVTIALATAYGDTTNPYGSKTANYFLAAPNGSAGAPTFRAIVAADIPTLNQSTTGNAATATKLATARNINTVAFDGTADITITAAAGTLTGTTLNSTVVNSSLTSVGTLTNLTVTNTITGSVSGNAGTATVLATSRNINGVAFNGSTDITVPAAAGTLTGGTLASGVTASSLTSVGTLSGLAATGTVNFGSATTVTVPTPVNGTDAANKNYVDNVASGVNAHDAVQYATTTTIAGTYTAGTTGADGGTGVGATITFSSTGVQAIDSSTNLALNDRVLVKNGVTADSGTASKANGIYYVSTAPAVGVAGVLTRALDADNSIAGDIMAGDLVYVLPSTGSTNGGTQWIQTATGTATTPAKGIKIGTDSITWTQFSGASSTTAGAGLVANGNAFDVATASSSRIVVNADNIDLATVSQTNTTGTAGVNFVQSHTVDSYGRVTGTVSADVRDATTSVKGIASFSSSNFTVTSGAVSLSANTISGVALGSNLNALSYGTGLTNTAGASSYNGSATSTIGFASGTATIGANDVAATYTYATQRASATLTGTGSKTSWTIAHNFGTRDIVAQVYQTSTTPNTNTQYSEVEVDIVRTATGSITVSFAVAPALNDTYNVVMVG